MANITNFVNIQQGCAENIDKIIKKREAEGIKDTKARIVAEAVSELAKKELND